MSKWVVFTQSSPWQPGHDVHIGVRNADGSLDAVTEISMTRVEEGALVLEPCLRGLAADDFLRAALNCAWELGLRPDGFNDTRESMKATNQHLQDMRALAFHKIGAAKP